MNDSGSSILNGEALTGRPPSTPGEGPGHGTRPRAFLGDTRGDVACGVCRVTLHFGHLAVRFHCGQGRHVFHAR